MANYGSKKPLNFDLRKGPKLKNNPSYESFRPNEIHEPQYEAMEDRPTTSVASRLRRYPDGKLDMDWTVRLIIDAVKKAEVGGPLTPLEESLLTVLFPLKFRKVEPQQAEIRTQLSRSEKSFLQSMAEARLKEELNWNGGLGGGNTPGRTRSLG